MGLTEEEFMQWELCQGGREIQSAPLAYKFELGKDLVDRKELRNLPTRVRDLHDWYKRLSNVGTTMFEARVPPEIYHTGEDTLWVDLEYLFNFFQKRDLDVQILSLWFM